MKQKKPLLSSVKQPSEFQVEVTLRQLKSDALLSFLERIVKPHYLGSLTAAVEDLMRNAVADEEFVTAYLNGT